MVLEHFAVPKIKEVLRGTSKGRRPQHEKVPEGESRNNLSNKRSNYSTGLKPIEENIDPRGVYTVIIR